MEDLVRWGDVDGVESAVCSPAEDRPGFILQTDVFGDNPRLTLVEAPRDVVGWLRPADAAHAHIHSLIGVSHKSALEILDCLDAAQVKFDLTVHDYSLSCPRVNLVDFSHRYCGEPDVTECETCVTIGPSPIIPIQTVKSYRQENLALLGRARRIFTPSEDTALRLESHFGRKLKISVRPHLIAQNGSPDTARKKKREPETLAEGNTSVSRVAILGDLTIHKGSELVLSVAEILSSSKIDVWVFGQSDRDEAFLTLKNVKLFGRYSGDTELRRLLESYPPDVVWFPAVWPETFSYTLSVALELGLPIVSFDFGAISERTATYKLGRQMPYELMLDPENVASEIMKLARGFRGKGTSGQQATAVGSIIDYYAYPLR